MFLVDRLDEVSAAAGTVVLDGAEGHHAATVRRLGVGEPVHVTDGSGSVLECTVADAGEGRLELAVVRRRDIPRPQPRVTVVQALAKGDRGELAVATMTEAGVDAIVPWQASRCVVEWKGPRGERARDRWASTAREAAKQSRRAWLPEVAELHHLPDVCRLVSAADAAYVLHEAAARPLARAALPESGEVVLVVGPEGGLTDGETLALRAAGAEPVRLGREVLRTSTAGLAGLVVVSARTGRWSSD